MKYVFTKIEKACFLACLFIVFLFSCKQKAAEDNKPEPKNNLAVNLQKAYIQNLNDAVVHLTRLQQTDTVSVQVKWYKKARAAFKKAEPILAFSDKENYKALNSPNILVIDEEDITNVKIDDPFGFQVIEELLFEDEINQKQLSSVAQKTANRLKLLVKNTTLDFEKYHILWLLRSQIARTALTGITGFDSPVLEQSLAEAKLVYQTLKSIVKLYESAFSDKKLYENWLNEFEETEAALTGDFNAFNRYEFIKNRAHNQLRLLAQTANDWQVSFPFALALKNDAASFFSHNTFDIDFFSDPILKNDNFEEKSLLGKQLFNDKRLSKDRKMSCATCHNEDKAFTDGLTIFPNQKRNTPTLPYAAYQKLFFYDGRAGSLEGQIVSVVENPDEFHTDLKSLTEAVKNEEHYTKQFQKLYGKTDDMLIRNAIATYIRSLGTFNSKFDDNMNNKANTLTAQEIHGFNLFMGKGKCATCHFPPVFNGTVPPDFTDTELEALGTPNPEHNALSEDLGGYDLFKTEVRKHFFKTPTVRNIAKTAPYMHNGTYKTLEEVMDFYNNGGGIGMGFQLEHQTLPPDSLHLSEQEISDLIAFMETLNDAEK